MELKKFKRVEDYSGWYNYIVEYAGLAQHSDVKGMMVIKPYGYAIWEKMQKELDSRFKETGHSNAYFPLFIPKSLFEAEEKNAEGFAKECAVVTHYRLKNDPERPGHLMVDPDAKLTEELVVRPTSEAIIWKTYKGWIKSYRDLPILINQWANVVRWEMRTRLFLRTAEFLWQEGHTAHATRNEAIDETIKMLDVYADFAENVLAVPVIKGVKTENERFAGAEETYCIEGMMQDGKALQMGTSHFLGQNFAKAFDVKYLSKENKQEHVWATSWGVSTRLMGAVIMAHSDDDGLVLPPRIAPLQVVIVPIFKTNEELELIKQAIKEIISGLANLNISVKLDDRDTQKPGYKFAEWELKGVPLRLAVGMRDIENGTVEMAFRDTREKKVIPMDGIVNIIEKSLIEMQDRIHAKAKEFMNQHVFEVLNWEDFTEKIELGFVATFWDGTTETELFIKEKTKATIRCVPFDFAEFTGNCVLTGKPNSQKVIFAKAY